ncbi:MATE family efflux transporter [Microbulbifer hydrolyticus]|uniref:MATE family efflux protein n=1 Tax=Microbulbifer hydrolyticus TaxID=48074 RepID=A0A6P1T906_9GAMM|nr:MATE family efflux transporter [Microbulbifer hydrolyticus]MBB5212924.1 putative MATE family efflux protein [Microbulbifer hydrolyticus]QHQ38291.1 MATE family efflux transporter [Microbulbifer hydrolyticus]
MPPNRTQPSLLEGPVAAHLRRLALPMVWGILATMSFNVVDTYFVAQLGDAPLAAMSFTFPVVMVINALAIGLGAGTSSAVARAYGAGDMVRVRQLVSDATFLALIIALAVSAVGLLTIEPLFHLLGAEARLLPLIADYMVPWYLGAVFAVVPMVSLSALRAIGNSSLTGRILMAVALFNLILDPLLIFGLFGFPRLELQGAALATVIARGLSFAIALYVLVRREQILTLPSWQWPALRDSWRTLLAVGLPAIATNVIIPMSGGVVVALVATHGVDAVAGLGVALRIEPVALIVFYALSSVVGPFMGQNAGAGLNERLSQTVAVMAKFCIVFGVILAAVLWVVGGPVASLFSDSPQVIAVAVAYLSLVPFSYAGYGFVMSANAAFNGLGHPLPGTFISFLRVLGVYLPLAWLGNRLWGIQGLFVATLISNLVLGVLAWWWLRKYLESHSSELTSAVAK